MGQTYTDDCFVAGNDGQADLTVMETNFETLRSSFSGAVAPGAVAGQTFFSTSTEGLQIRNAADDDWMGAFLAEATTKIWMYSNTAEDGWLIDATVTDHICSLKGGSDAYNVNGGAEAGSWVQSDHALILAEMPTHTHSSPGDHSHSMWGSGGSSNYSTGLLMEKSSTGINANTSSDGAHIHDSVGSGNSHNHGSTHRPYAAIGTRQYMAGLT